MRNNQTRPEKVNLTREAVVVRWNKVQTGFYFAKDALEREIPNLGAYLTAQQPDSNVTDKPETSTIATADAPVDPERVQGVVDTALEGVAKSDAEQQNRVLTALDAVNAAHMEDNHEFELGS